MTDYTWPSVYFAYLFFVKTLRDGYWSRDAEEIKHRMFDGTD